MKQRIKISQLGELSEEALERFVSAFYPPHHKLAIIDKKVIDPEQPKKLMIFDEGKTYVYFTQTGNFFALPNIGQMMEYLGENPFICDELWEKTKEKLEEQ